MSKANRDPITPNRRRFLSTAAIASAAVVLPAIPAAATLAKGRDDTRLFAMIARVRSLLPPYVAAEARAQETHALADADPDMPQGSPVAWVAEQRASGSLLSERVLDRLYWGRADKIWTRHGYSAASDEWNRLGHELRFVHLPRLLSMRPRTAEGARDKWRLVFEAFRETDQWDPEDFDEFMVPALLADLERLAKGGAA
jgi:hypothetical protein